jgi:SecA DEAD-like domain
MVEIAGSDDEVLSSSEESVSSVRGDDGAGGSSSATNESVDPGGWKEIFVTLQGTSGSASSADEANEDIGARENEFGTMEPGHGAVVDAGPPYSAPHHRPPPEVPQCETCESDLLGGNFEPIVLDGIYIDDNDSMMETDSLESLAPGAEVERGDQGPTDDAEISCAPTLRLLKEPGGKYESLPQETRENEALGGPRTPIVVEGNGIQEGSFESSTRGNADGGGGDEASAVDAVNPSCPAPALLKGVEGAEEGGTLAKQESPNKESEVLPGVTPGLFRSLDSLVLPEDSGKINATAVEDAKQTSELVAEEDFEVASEVQCLPEETAGQSGSVEIIQGVTTTNDSMIIEEEGECLPDVKRVALLDIDLLCTLLERTQNAGDALDGQDVLLFVGGTGSGKTTTVLYLAGAQFEEDDSTGFFHYKPVQFPVENLKEFEVDPGGRSITKTICATRTQLSDGTEVVLVDTPGFSDTEGAEYDIANGLGLIRALQRAKSVRPVLVFNSQLFGDRFRSLTETVDTVNRMMGGAEANVDFTKFRYLFTRCEGREVRLIHRKLSMFISELMEQDGTSARAQLLPLLEDMRQKTSPLAPSFNPLDSEERLTLLHELWGDSDALLALTPSDFFQFLSVGVGDKLRGELERRFAIVEADCNSTDFQSVHKNLVLLRRLSIVLPEAADAANRALSFFGSFLSRSCKIVLYQFKDLWQLDLEARCQVHGSLEDVKNAIRTLLRVPEPAFCLVSTLGQDQPCSVAELFQEMVKSCPRVGRSLAVEDRHSVQLTLFLLYKVSESMASVSGGEAFSLHFLREFDKALAHTTSALRDVERWVAAETIDELLKIESPISFAMGLATFLKAEEIAEAENRAVINDSLNVALDAVQRRLRRSIDRVSSVAQRLKGSIAEGQILHIAFADVADVSNSRTFLLAFRQMKEICVLASSTTHTDPTLVSDFDGLVISTLWRIPKVAFNTISSLEKHLSDSVAVDFEDRRESLQLCVEAVNGALSLSRAMQSWPFINVPQRLLEQLMSAKHRLRASLEKLDECAKLFARGYGDAVQSATEFSMRMSTPGVDASALYIELFDHWEGWCSLLDATKGHKAVTRWITSWLDRKSGKQKELGETISSVLSKLNGWLNSATCRLLALPETDPLLLLQQRSEDALFLIAFFRTPMALTLGPRVLSGAWGSTGQLRQRTANAFRKVTEVIDKIKELPGSFLASRKFDHIDLLLNRMDQSQLWMSSIRSIASCVVYSSCIVNGFVSEDELEHFNKSLFEIPSCESVLCAVEQAVKELAVEVELASLSQLTNARNEQDRDKGCQGLAKLLSTCLTVGAVARHLKSESDVAASLYQDLLQRIDADLQSFRTDMLELTSSFPEDQSSFTQINCICCSILSFKHRFEDVNPTLANMASKLFNECHSDALKSLDQFSVKRSEHDCDDFAQCLILLKMASREIPCWKTEIDRCIDKLINDRVSRSDKPEEFLLDLSLALRRFCGDDSVVAEQLLSDHGKFQGVLTSIFSEATAGQDITYVLNGLDLSPEQFEKFEILYSSFLEVYTTKVLDGVAAFRSGEQSLPDFISILVADALRAASDESLEFSEMVLSLSSSLFAHWSLTSLSDLVLLENQSSSVSKYVLKPHAAQVVACWAMLNVHNADDYHALEHHLIQLGTGEGKSIVLGVVASILALLGYSVDVLCYSSYLSGRDRNAFRDMFADFGVDRCIWYGTLKGLAHRIVGNDYYVEARAMIEGLETANRKSVEFRPSVLLVDEVDIFFGGDVFGSVNRNCLSFSPKSFLTLLKSIWSRSATSVPTAACPTYPELEQFLGDLPPSLHPFVKQSIRSMEQAADSVRSGSSVAYQVVDDRIAYKYFDGVDTNVYKGYHTHFQYISEWERGRVSDASMELHSELLYRVAVTSYAEYPFSYDSILGITGTLRALNSDERAVLEGMFGIQSFSYIPSVFGRNKLVFAGDDEKGTNVRPNATTCVRFLRSSLQLTSFSRCEDFKLCDTRGDHIFELKQELLRRRKSAPDAQGLLRPVMMFFYSKESLVEFHNSKLMESLKNQVAVVTETTPTYEKESLFLKATEAGSITLLVRDFGRGTDFKCFDRRVLQAGGVHVIQAFFSKELAEEIQLKGRCARQGMDGSFRYDIGGKPVFPTPLNLKMSCSIRQHGPERRRPSTRFWP